LILFVQGVLYEQSKLLRGLNVWENRAFGWSRQPLKIEQLPRGDRNVELRTREHLTVDEVERLIKAASNNRYGHRGALMILLTLRHGLRAAEVCDLQLGPGGPIRAPQRR
jgi:integrase